MRGSTGRPRVAGAGGWAASKRARAHSCPPTQAHIPTAPPPGCRWTTRCRWTSLRSCGRWKTPTSDYATPTYLSMLRCAPPRGGPLCTAKRVSSLQPPTRPGSPFRLAVQPLPSPHLSSSPFCAPIHVVTGSSCTVEMIKGSRKGMAGGQKRGAIVSAGRGWGPEAPWAYNRGGGRGKGTWGGKRAARYDGCMGVSCNKRAPAWRRAGR